MPLVRGGRPLKRWTYVGAYGPELMVCAASARIGVVPVAWWAVWDRTTRRLNQGHHSVRIDARRFEIARLSSKHQNRESTKSVCVYIGSALP